MHIIEYVRAYACVWEPVLISIPARSWLHDPNWLMFQRSLWVSERDNRNSVWAGRTGTRLNIGRPQVRWQDGLSVAESVRKSRDVSIKGNNALSISSRIRESLNELRSSASQCMRWMALYELLCSYHCERWLVPSEHRGVCRIRSVKVKVQAMFSSAQCMLRVSF